VLAYAFLFLAVYSLDYLPGVMDAKGKMFGLLSMTPMVAVGSEDKRLLIYAARYNGR
jgi:hypothetical protein